MITDLTQGTGPLESFETERFFIARNSTMADIVPKLRQDYYHVCRKEDELDLVVGELIIDHEKQKFHILVKPKLMLTKFKLTLDEMDELRNACSLLLKRGEE